jgi:preprotein translocase subunit SecB
MDLQILYHFTQKESAMVDQAQQNITINAQYVKALQFSNDNAPRSLMNLTEAPQVNIAVDVKANKFSDEVYEVALAIKAEANAKDLKCFTCDLTYCGLVTLKGIAANQLQAVLLVECPRLLFPFARSIIADITREGGYAPLLVHPIDFLGLYQQQMKSGGLQAAPTKQ